MIARALWAVAGLVVLLPGGTALACSACRDPNDPSQGAFLLGTILLSLLPLAMFLGLALYVRRCLRASARAGAEVGAASGVASESPAE